VPDPNPKHAGKGFRILRRAGVEVFELRRHVGALKNGDLSPHAKSSSRGRSSRQTLADECQRLNETFNHWIVHRTPFVTVKAAMTLDGKIAAASGESKWITGEAARAYGMKLRQGTDAILVGINTILADNPSLTARTKLEAGGWRMAKPIRRIILDSMARTPLGAKVASDNHAAWTTIVVGKRAPKNRVAALSKRVKVVVAPLAKSSIVNRQSSIDLRWLLKKLCAENVTSLLVEGGGEVNASFLLGGLAQRVAFFYAPKILGGRDSRKAVAGEGARNLAEIIRLRGVEWKRLGPDLLLIARVVS
jgi:diaminohydroxyphosphoribosylaminopyrimidine deaminase/5-amino-6-(5-phosphoribosylamino)uracil reductase